MKKAILGLAGLGVGLAAAAMFALPAQAANTTARGLVNADNDRANWLLHHRTYDGQRYSPLSEINTGTVKDLRLRFFVILDGLGSAGRVRQASMEGTPLAEDGFLYVTDGWNNVYKIDVRSGDRASIVWKFDPEMDRAYAADSGCCQGRNRGVALINDLVIESTQDGRMIALDKASGEIVWQADTANNDLMESHTGAPMVLKNLAINGVTGAEYGIRGHIDAVNVDTGETEWVKILIPGPGEPGFETWMDDYNAWQTGGASVWQTGTFDAELNIMYWGTGNPSPQYDAEYRPGDNLYTESLLAMDPDTGDILWHFQFTPNDPYDWDEVGETQFMDVEIDGVMRKIITRAARNGHVYGFDRADGAFLFGIQYVDFENWAFGIDQKTGLPNTYDPNTPVQLYGPGTVGRRDGRLAVFCPALGGGKNWQPAAYSRQTGLNYVPGSEGCSAYTTTVGGVDHWKDKGNKLGQLDNRDPAGWRGRNAAPAGTERPVSPSYGAVTGYDVRNGQTVVKTSLPTRPSGMLATAGGLVFTGMASDLMGFNAETLETLYSFSVGTGVRAPPMTYSYGGRQYIAILAGAGVSGSLGRANPIYANMTATSMLAVFSL